MIKNIVSSVGLSLALAVAAQAGTSDKTITQPMTTVDYGTGAYIALQGGFNADQGTSQDHDLSTKSCLGGFGGLKAGYVFGSGPALVRPAVEFDGFYNGFDQNVYYRGAGFYKVSADTAAYMVNGLARFNLGAFQPYAGVGAGVYTANVSDVVPNQGSFPVAGEATAWAWQLVAGLDYYVTPKISIFAEYKWLNYMDAQQSYLCDRERLGQQLAGGGVRFHF